jgi:glutathione S-transferase
MLEELQIPYELINALPVAKEVLKYNTSGKIPVLLVNDDGEEGNEEPSYCVTESAVINTYLGDRFPDKCLVPKFGSRQRIVYDELISKSAANNPTIRLIRRLTSFMSHPNLLRSEDYDGTRRD